MQILGLLIVALFTVFILDIIWLGFLAKKIYIESVGMLLRGNVDGMAPIWPAAFMVYLMMALGIIFFVIPKANGQYLLALLWGGLFGAVVYGIYDFTNYSLLAKWPLNITIIDLIWGTILCGISSVVILFFQNRFFS